MTIAVVLLSGGLGQRFGSPIPKQYLPLLGSSVLSYSFGLFDSNACISYIQIVASKKDEKFYSQLRSKKISDVVAKPGKSRQESVFSGLLALEARKPEYVLIHDCVRPVITHKIINRVCLQLSKGRDGVVPVVYTKDSACIKDQKSNYIENYVDRTKLMLVQTPQGFNYQRLLSCHKKAISADKQYTDDSSLAKDFGMEIFCVAGSEKNIKITTPTDFYACQAFLQAKD